MRFTFRVLFGLSLVVIALACGAIECIENPHLIVGQFFEKPLRDFVAVLDPLVLAAMVIVGIYMWTSWPGRTDKSPR